METVEASQETRKEKQVKRLAWTIILSIGAVQAFNHRNALFSDNLSYLDVGDLWLKGDFKHAINGYWSPLYSIILSAFCQLVPQKTNEPVVAHFLTFVFLVGLLFAFDFLLIEARKFSDALCPREDRSNGYRMRLLILGYTFFGWALLDQMTIGIVSPDFLVGIALLLATWLLFKIKNQGERLTFYAGLGLLLGIGYWTKTIVFILAPFFILGSVFCARALWRGIAFSVVSCAVFALIASPHVYLLSQSKGRLTYGDSGRLAYVWMVNQVSPWFHWRGEEPGSGTPAHPTRQVSKLPAIYEYRGGLGTYPPWFDPSYWNEGIRVRFSLTNQLKALNKSLQSYYDIFLGTATPILFIFWIAYSLLRGNRQAFCVRLRELWPLLVGPVVCLMVYSLVLVLSRYIAPAILIIFTVLATCLEGEKETPHDRSCLVGFALIAALPIIFSLIADTIKSNTFKRDELSQHQIVAQALQILGLKPGDEIAVMGRACHSSFARYLRLKVVAEAFRDEANMPLWAQDPEMHKKAVETLSKLNVKAIVLDLDVKDAGGVKWQKIPRTGFSVLLLKP